MSVVVKTEYLVSASSRITASGGNSDTNLLMVVQKIIKRPGGPYTVIYGSVDENAQSHAVAAENEWYDLKQW